MNKKIVHIIDSSIDVMIMNSDIIESLRTYLTEKDILHLFKTCSIWYAFRASFTFRNYYPRQTNNVQQCEAQIAPLYAYEYVSHDICRKLQLRFEHSSSQYEDLIECETLPDHLQKLSVFIISTKPFAYSKRWIQTTNQLKKFTLHTKTNVILTQGETFELQQGTFFNSDSMITMIQLPLTLKRLSISFSLWNTQYQWRHVHTLKVERLHIKYTNEKTFPFPQLHVLKIKHYENMLSQCTTLKELYIDMLINGDFPDSLRVLHIKNSHQYDLPTFPSRLKDLFITCPKMHVHHQGALPLTLKFFHLDCNDDVKFIIPKESRLKILKLPNMHFKAILPITLKVLHAKIFEGYIPSRLCELRAESIVAYSPFPATLRDVIITKSCKISNKHS